MLKLCQHKQWFPICKQGAGPQTGKSGAPKGSQGHPSCIVHTYSNKNTAM